MCQCADTTTIAVCQGGPAAIRQEGALSYPATPELNCRKQKIVDSLVIGASVIGVTILNMSVWRIKMLVETRLFHFSRQSKEFNFPLSDNKLDDKSRLVTNLLTNSSGRFLSFLERQDGGCRAPLRTQRLLEVIRCMLRPTETSHGDIPKKYETSLSSYFVHSDSWWGVLVMRCVVALTRPLLADLRCS